MAASGEITALEFLQGYQRQNLFLWRNYRKPRCKLLWGSSRCRSSSRGVISSRGCSFRGSSPVEPRAVVSGDMSSAVNAESIKTQSSPEKVIHFYRVPLIQESATAELLKLVQMKISSSIIGLRTEQCYNIGLDVELSSDKFEVLKWLLQETYEPENLATESFLDREKQEGVTTVVVEVGPRLNFTTAWSANAVSICQACELTEVTRIERSRRYLLCIQAGTDVLQDDKLCYI